MSDWTHADGMHLRSAEGWIDLGLPEEARAEIEQLPRELREQPVTLMVRWRLHAAAKEWSAAAQVGEMLVERDAANSFGWIHRSFALHEQKKSEEAWDKLLPALEKFPEEELIAYNLACYACQLGRMEEAQTLLRTACKRGKSAEIKARALDDPDLVPLREYILKLRG